MYSARTGHLLGLLAQAGVGRGRGEALDVDGEDRQGPQRRAADGEEAGEAAEDVIVGRCGDAAPWAVERGDVEAALMREQEAAPPIQASSDRAARLEDRQRGDQRRGVGDEMPVDRGDLARVLAEVGRGLEQACDDVEALEGWLRRGRGPLQAGPDGAEARPADASSFLIWVTVRPAR